MDPVTVLPAKSSVREESAAGCARAGRQQGDGAAVPHQEFEVGRDKPATRTVPVLAAVKSPKRGALVDRSTRPTANQPSPHAISSRGP